MTYLRKLDVRIWLIVVAIVAVGWLQMPRLSDNFRVDEDFRTFYWMNKFQDPTLFPNYVTGYTILHLPWGDVPVTFYSLGYSLLFYAASMVMSPVLFSKLLAFGLAPLMVWCLFKFGQAVRHRGAGVALALGFLFFNLASSSSVSITNGLQRSFAAPLLIGLMYFLHSRRYAPAALMVFLAALIYAPVLALGLMIWGLWIMRLNWPLQWPPKLAGGGYLALALGLSVLILLPVLSGGGGSETAAAAQGTSLWHNPTLGPDGSYQLFVIFPVVGRGGLVDLGEDLINWLILAAVGGLIYWGRGRRAFDLPPVVWLLWWATWLMFILSWLVALWTQSFLLYLPSRYTRVGLALFLIIVVFLNIADFVREAPALIRRNPRHLIWLVVGLEILVWGLVIGYPPEWALLQGFNMKWLLGLVGLVFGILGVAVIRKPPLSGPTLRPFKLTRLGRVLVGVMTVLGLLGWAIYAPLLTEVSYLNPPPAERALLRFLATLPKEVRLAGSPCALDSVPLFAGRQVLFNCEQDTDLPVVPEALAAYYTDKPQVLVGFCRAQRLDYLVVDLKTYSQPYLERRHLFYEPYNRALLANLAGQNTFVLAQLPDHLKVFQADNFFVAPCAALEQSN